MPQRHDGETTGQEESFARLRALVGEQAALRRVATLVASGAEPVGVFACVCAEMGGVLEVGSTNLTHFDADGTQTVVGGWSVAGMPVFPVGGELPFSDNSVTWKVFRTGRPARIDDYTGLEGELPERLRALGILSAVAAPITVNRNLWGTVVAASTEPNGLPAGTELRIADFAELVSDALASADAREQLAASRARIVEAADAERRRLERNLHDGAQQRLVSLAVALRSAETRLRDDPDGAERLLARARDELALALDELRALAHGIHPGILSDRGLGAALEQLSARAPLPVEVSALPAKRFPDQVEVAAYYLVAEGVTNAAKHSQASFVAVRVIQVDDRALIEVSDDGVGGAELSGGTGLRGLADRLEALGGGLDISSSRDAGTTLAGRIPLR
jgi:signal transduction histidine kinase